jgi:energy-coupling factor transport system substrate-specific component
LRPRLALAAFVALGIAGVLWAVLDPVHGGLATLLAAFALVAGGFAWLEQGGDAARDITLVATLGGIAAAGRVLFAPIPNVQPVTVIVAAAGVALGPRRGFAVGALAAIASNMFLGQGPHTPWQMLAWGGCGFLAGVFGLALRRRWAFALFCAVLGMAFGTLMDVWLWFAFYPHTWAALVTVLVGGFAFNVAHALGNLVLALVAGPELRRVLDRHGRSAHTEVVWA